MTQLPRFKSIQVPVDLLEAVKTFHEARDTTSALAAKATADFQKEGARIQAIYAAAENEIAKVLYAAKIVPEGSPFGIDSRYIDEHGIAFIQIPDDSIPENPLKEKMN